jgi:hypothetical protein
MDGDFAPVLRALIVMLFATLLTQGARADISLYTLYDAFSVRLVARTASEHCIAVQAALSPSDGIADAIYSPPQTLPLGADGVTPVDKSPVIVPASSIGFVSLGNALFCTSGKLVFQSIKPTSPPKLVHGSYFEKVINFLALSLPDNSLLFGTGLLTGCSGTQAMSRDIGLNISGMGITTLPKEISTKLVSGGIVSFSANVKYVGLGVSSRLGDDTVCIFSDSPKESIKAGETIGASRKSSGSGEFGSDLSAPEPSTGNVDKGLRKTTMLGIISGLSIIVIVIILAAVYFELKRRKIFVSPSGTEGSRSRLEPI